MAVFKLAVWSLLYSHLPIVFWLSSIHCFLFLFFYTWNLKDILSSTSPPLCQKYVQDALREQLSETVYQCLREEGGHIYVCGDVTMAGDVLKTVQQIIKQQGNMSLEDSGFFISKLRVRERKKQHRSVWNIIILMFTTKPHHAARSDVSLKGSSPSQLCPWAKQSASSWAGEVLQGSSFTSVHETECWAWSHEKEKACWAGASWGVRKHPHWLIFICQLRSTEAQNE